MGAGLLLLNYMGTGNCSNNGESDSRDRVVPPTGDIIDVRMSVSACDLASKCVLWLQCSASGHLLMSKAIVLGLVPVIPGNNVQFGLST